MLSILPSINKSVKELLNDQINNPILKRVIYEEIIYSGDLKHIFKEYFSNLVLINPEHIENNIKNVVTLLDNVKEDVKPYVNKQLTLGFVNLSPDEQLHLILNITESFKKIFVEISKEKSILEMINYLLSSLSFLTFNDKQLIKFIQVCNIINPAISDKVIIDILNKNDLGLINNDNLLPVVVRYYMQKYDFIHHECPDRIEEILVIKFDMVKIKINTYKLDNMDMAFEIYKLGKFICHINISYNSYTALPKITLTDQQLEYIVKSIHTSLINNNTQQAKYLLAVIYIFDNKNIKSFMNYYNDWLLIRIKKNINNIIEQENEIWHINDDMEIKNLNIFNTYNIIINNIKYSNYINSDLQKIEFKDNIRKLDNVNIKLITNSVSDSDYIIHHPKIKMYINNISKYIDKRTKLQKIVHDSKLSKITLTTKYGTIKCPLILGSILLYLNEGNKTLMDLADNLNIDDNELEKKLKILIFYNIVVCINNIEYKYIDPYGSIECEDSIISNVSSENMYIKFTDIIMTIESRIIKYVKPEKIHKMELERKVQEFLGSSFCRNIYYNQLESLKKRYYIEENNDIIEYVP